MSERDLIDNDLIESLNGEIVAVMWKSPLGVDRVALQGHYEPLTKDPIPLWPLSSVTQLVATIARLSEALAEAEKKGAEAAATIAALQNPWSSDMSAMPRGQDVLVYQPPHKAGCDTIPARICELRNSGYARVSTHWMLPAPPRDLSQGGQHG